MPDLRNIGECGAAFRVAPTDCGVGLYAGEMINVLRKQDEELMLFRTGRNSEYILYP